jgi:excisionase family DNA binding protein
LSKRLVTAAAAARELEVNKSTVTRWIAAGKLPAFRTPGGHWRVRTVDVERLKKGMGL